MNAGRPDPDALLARVHEEEARQRRGKLKVFFGAAAGVGKTYAMLEAVRERTADGVDVIVGYVETHGRAETDALLEGLEQLPARGVEYRGATLREFDLDGALARRPALVAVDELAHTNVPGSRHPKRWQDVLELLDAGIDVYTTVNVQHLESLNDVVAKITGIVVRETVPDSVLERADEVELIDLPPDDLLERLAEGKVYMPEQAQDAVRNFFRKGNLIALRELALRETAERVDAQMRVYMREHAIASLWPAGERLLVCVGPSPFSRRLVRAGKRMAERLGAEWIVAYVETPKHLRMTVEDRERVVQTLRLAEQLGAETTTLSGRHMSEEILAFAKARNVTKILVGKPSRSLWRRIVMGSIVDAIVEGSGETDVYVTAGEGEEAPPVAARQPVRREEWRGIAEAVAVVALATALAWLMFPRFAASNLIMTYLLGVIVVAMRHGRKPSLLASVLSVAAFDFFFVPPYFTFAVSDTQYLVTFVVMLVVALVIGGLTSQIRSQAEGARDRERGTAALYALSRDLASTRGVDELLAIAARHISAVFDCRAVMLLADRAGRLAPVPDAAAFEVDANELAVARWAVEHRQPAGLGTSTLPGASSLYVPLVASRGPVGAIGVRPGDPHEMDAPERLHQLETFANQTALVVERALLVNEARDAELEIETERLRSSLLSSVSHDLRTPLATITGAVSTVLERGPRLDDPTRRELLESVREEADRLNRLVQNLLEMTRLESGTLQLRREPHPIEEVIGSALNRLGKRLGGRRVTTRIPPDLPLVSIDGVLIEQLLWNLLDNALKYTPPGSPIDIIATATEESVTVEVADHGPGLPPGHERKVFEKFFQEQPGTGRGTGLGLAICHGIVRAHGGRIWAQNVPEGGVAFLFTLPLGEAPPAMVAADG